LSQHHRELEKKIEKEEEEQATCEPVQASSERRGKEFWFFPVQF
jgi:hypothetical protein